MPVPTSDELAEVREDVLAYKTQLSRGRDARLIAAKSTYVPLEAAHIHAHARKGPDSATNGLALTPTAHDLFDAGLWTIDDDLRIRVAQSDLIESIHPGGSHFKLSDLHGWRLSFAPQAILRPDPTHLAWHRREIFAH
jgi:putative restriction endonuclease